MLSDFEIEKSERPNSAPLGSDLMFELPDAFIHIEVKTALIDNPADYKGKINIAINQTSYDVEGLFTPNLPQYYNPEEDNEKVYGKNIFKSGKSGYAKGKDFRYSYSTEPHFRLLTERYKEEVFRVEMIYLAKGLKPEEITNLSNLPVHFQF